MKDIVFSDLSIDSVFNINSATGTLYLPTNQPIKTRLLYRKINATQGNITINAQGSEKITSALLSSVTLNADGDFWLLEKVSDTRWDLIAGYERGSNSDGTYARYHNGKQECNMNYTGALTMTQKITGIYTATLNKTFPKAFSSSKITLEKGSLIDSASTGLSLVVIGSSVSVVNLVYIGFVSSITGTSIDMLVTGWWY